jgi:Fe-S cluster assembly iron-binding protein IscA
MESTETKIEVTESAHEQIAEFLKTHPAAAVRVVLERGG